MTVNGGNEQDSLDALNKLVDGERAKFPFMSRDRLFAKVCEQPRAVCEGTAAISCTAGGKGLPRVFVSCLSTDRPSICPNVLGLNYLIGISQFAADRDRCKFSDCSGMNLRAPE